MSQPPFYLKIYFTDGKILEIPYDSASARSKTAEGIARAWKTDTRTYLKLADPETVHWINTDQIIRLKEIGR